jgi:hypothetical protein
MINIESAMELLPGFQYLYKGDTDELDASIIGHIIKQGWAMESSSETRINAVFQAGMDKNDIYCTSSSSLSTIKGAIGKCRFIASGMDELKLINEVASDYLAHGHLESVGLSVVADDYDDEKLKGFRMKDLPELSKEARRLPFISIRGCFILGNVNRLTGESLGRYIQNCYGTAKQISTLIPCKISYVNLAGCLQPVLRTIGEGQEASKELKTLSDIVSSLNKTPFNAGLLIQ